MIDALVDSKPMSRCADRLISNDKSKSTGGELARNRRCRRIADREYRRRLANATHFDWQRNPEPGTDFSRGYCPPGGRYLGGPGPHGFLGTRSRGESGSGGSRPAVEPGTFEN